jgi:hypothetical protein
VESDNIKVADLCPTCFCVSFIDYYYFTYIPLFCPQYNLCCDVLCVGSGLETG